MDLIREKLKLLTTEPGCYLMKDENDKIIYVGKAKNLKRRVSSYFNKEQTGKTKALVEACKDERVATYVSNTFGDSVLYHYERLLTA